MSEENDYEQLQFEGMAQGEVDGDIPPPAPETGYTIPLPDETPKVECITAFIVYITDEGKAVADSRIEERLGELNIRRPATSDDFRRACEEVVFDVGVMSNTQSVLNAQVIYAQQMQQRAVEAQQNQEIMQRLGGGKLLGSR